MRSDTIIVTGGAGFIGSAIVWGLNQRGMHDILIVDRFDGTDKWKNLVGLRFRDCIQADSFRESVRQGNGLQNAMAMIHMGACASTTETDAAYLLDNNYHSTRELAEACVQRGVRFIYASSAATYGDGQYGYEDDEDRLESLRPLNIYGYSKHLFDLHAKRVGLFKTITGLKFSNVFGPNEYHKSDMASMVFKAFRQIQETERVRLYRSYRSDVKDGCQMRDFVYVKDVVAMVLFFLDHAQITGIFNVGSGQARTWNDVVAAVFRAVGKAPAIDYIEMPAELQRQYQYFSELPSDRIRATGYDGAVTRLEEAVQDFVCNYLAPGRHLDTHDQV
jgi:ADP-L-glycero-D-manno-heptose 6-epimerase